MFVNKLFTYLTYAYLRNLGDWEVIDSFGFRFIVGPNVGGNPLLEPAFLLFFLIDFP